MYFRRLSAEDAGGSEAAPFGSWAGRGAERRDLATLSRGRVPVSSMADSGLLLKRGSCRSTWLRARKARPQLILSRRPRRRLGTLRWCGRRRLRRRLLQAQAAGVDWREGARQVSRAAAAGRPKTATPSPIPSPTPASEPESEFESASSCRRPLLIPPVRPVGPGRALLLLPVEQVGGGRRQESPRAGRAGEAAPGELQGRRGPWSLGPLLWLSVGFKSIFLVLATRLP